MSIIDASSAIIDAFTSIINDKYQMIFYDVFRPKGRPLWNTFEDWWMSRIEDD